MHRYIFKNIQLIASILLAIAIIIVFKGITQTFYQQDEWYGYGLYLSKGSETIFQNVGGIWGVIFGQGRIFSNLLYFLFYKYFPLNTFPVAIFAISLHIANVLIVFYLARKLFKSILPAFLGSLFFAFSSVSQSAITWAAASINTLPSTTLILVALIFYFRYLEDINQKWLLLSFLFVYLSLFFKESGVFLLLFLPFTSLLYKKQNVSTFIKKFWYWILSALLIVIFRIILFKSESNDVALFLTGSSKYFFDSLNVRAIFYPLTSFSLSIINPTHFINLARYIENVYYPFIPAEQFALISQTTILDFLSSISTFLLISAFISRIKKSDISEKRNVVFWITFILVSFLPYIIISKNFSYLESRYYYLSSVGWSFIFTWIFDALLNKTKHKIIGIVFLFFYTLFIFDHLKYIRLEINSLIEGSKVREDILSQIIDLEPKLEKDKNIFYITSDSDFYIIGNKVPFQNGFGYILMSLYYDSGKISKELLNQGYLFEIGSEGYKVNEGLGFGYFSDLTLLKEVVAKYKIPKDSIYSFEYDSKNKKLKETLTDNYYFSKK